jgi:adenylyltransferase/sulfurtransferase
MNDEQLLRYSRQIMLPQVDAEGQDRLLGSRVLVIGLGGLGSPIAMYLAAAGVGHIEVCDFDTVEISNLQRQIVHGTPDIGRSKVASAVDRLRSLNPEIEIVGIEGALEGDALIDRVGAADAVVDGSDNFGTRFAVNEASVKTGTPLISGAVIRMEGQITTFIPGEADSPCYRCLYKDDDEEMQTCSQNGVLAPVPGIVGSIQATEVLKLLIGLPTLCGRLLLLDAERMELRALKLPRDPGCPVCGGTQAA